MSWVEEETARIKREDERQETARKWAIHKANVLAKQAGELWSVIERQVTKDLLELNASFAEDSRRQLELEEIPPFAFSLQKKHNHALQITVRMSTDGRSIKMKIREVHNSLGVSSDKEDSIGIDLDENEKVFFISKSAHIASVEVVSHMIFEPFLRIFQL